MKIYIKKSVLLALLLLLQTTFLFSKAKIATLKIHQDGLFTLFRLDRPFHPKFGREIAGAVAMGYKKPILFVARRYGITLINCTNYSSRYIALPRSVSGAELVSLYVSTKNVWVGSSDGYLYRYMRMSKKWRSYRLPGRGVIRLYRIGNSLTAVTAVPGGGVYLFLERKNLFYKVFSLPKELAITPLCVSGHGMWRYLGTNTGLFRFARNRKKWEMLGTKDQLAKVIVNSIAKAGKYLLLAGSKPQFARLPSNIRINSYGVFVYNYLQRRWERRSDFPSVAFRNFLKLNRKNIQLPKSGIWLYSPKSDRAIRFAKESAAFTKIAVLGGGYFLAASRSGLFVVRKEKKEFVITKLVSLKDRWIDDIIVGDDRVIILTGRSVFVSYLSSWTGVPITTQPLRRKRHIKKRFIPESDEDRFIRQIKRYLRRLRKSE